VLGQEGFYLDWPGKLLVFNLAMVTGPLPSNIPVGDWIVLVMIEAWGSSLSLEIPAIIFIVL
jgi:hypothetical protein